MEKIKLGVSACLLGENVRYNGGHQLDRFIRDHLGQWVEYVPVCPETECGLGVPRETMRLEGDPQSPRLITHKSKSDLTDKMARWAQKRVVELEKENLCGFIFKKGSPSSGLMRVKVYNDKGMPVQNGVGMFARAFTEHFPQLPVEEDGRLNDPKLRETFIENLFVFKRLRELLQKKKRRGALVDFHTRHKLLLLSRSQKHYRLMGKLTAGASDAINEIYDQYQQLLAEALALKSTIKKNINVLQHIMGYFKKQLSADEKQELLELIGLYRDGHAPLIVPITMMNHYVRKYDQPYLQQQYYLNPHPVELHLRNHV